MVTIPLGCHGEWFHGMALAREMGREVLRSDGSPGVAMAWICPGSADPWPRLSIRLLRSLARERARSSDRRTVEAVEDENVNANGTQT